MFADLDYIVECEVKTNGKLHSAGYFCHNFLFSPEKKIIDKTFPHRNYLQSWKICFKTKWKGKLEKIRVSHLLFVVNLF